VREREGRREKERDGERERTVNWVLATREDQPKKRTLTEFDGGRGIFGRAEQVVQ
jgi:hypothetical protein